MKVLLADDHEVVRRGLRQMLADEFEKVAFGEATTAAEALARASKEKWDLLVLDINMPGRSRLDVLRDIKAQRPKLPVLVLSMSSEEEYAVRVLKKGAAGYLSKQSLGTELIAAVKKVLAGGRYVTPSLAEKLAAELEKPAGAEAHDALSDRELQVMKLLAMGRSVKEIAGELSLSEKTVFTYRDRLMGKLGVQSNVELARYALKHGLVE
jgi:DNA-binding NarL/FixJ family response regulator